MTTYNLADLWEGVVDELGAERTVLVTGDAAGNRAAMTHAELDERANRLAHHLVSRGVAAGDRVGIHLHNRAEYVEATLAAFKLRAIPVNVNYRYVADELRYLLGDSGAISVITEADLADRVQSVQPDLPGLLEILPVGDAYEDALAGSSPERPTVHGRSGDDLYLLYTGGTTGMPKGVMWRHEDLFFGPLGGTGVPRQGIGPLDDPDRIGAWARRGLGVDRRMPLCPLMHGLGHWITMMALLSGGQAVLSTDRSFDAAAALRLATDQRVQLIVLVGDAVARPLADELAAHPDRYDLSELVMISSSGAVLSQAVQDALVAAVPHVKIANRFGASETGPQGQMRGGRLAAGAHTMVVDDQLRPVQPGSGETGRLAQRGPIPLGYWNDPEKTAATFPEIDGVRWSIPGDFATVEADGSITVFGRGSTVINSGGEKIFPEEVEDALKAHAAVFDAIVVGVPDERFGSRVAAVVQLRPGADAPSLEELREHCASRVSTYKLPRELVVVDATQRTASGKADYAWARDAALAAISPPR